MVPYKNLHTKIPHNLFQQFLTLILCLLLIKPTIIFAAPEVADKSVNTSSEEMDAPKEPSEAIKIQGELTSDEVFNHISYKTNSCTY